jgi:serine phosphatase RsbU (regulator of sigma subunit)/ligand-binding sensor domain-containing protein
LIINKKNVLNRLIFCFLVFSTAFLPLYAQITNSFSNELKGIPFHANFSRKEYNAHNQNFGIAQDDRNVIFVANKQGILQFDGKNWQTIKGTENRLFYSIAKARDGVIYAGGYGEIGKIAYSAIGQTYYQSLTPQIPKKYQGFKEVWSTYPCKEGVIFQTENTLFWFKKEKLFKTLTPDNGSFYLSFLCNQDYYVFNSAEGLFKLVGGELEPIQSLTTIKGVIAVLSAGKNLPRQFLVLSDYDGFYLYDGNDFFRQSFPCDALLRKYIPYHAISLSDGNIAIATFNGGIIIINASGEVLARYHKGNILQDDQVISLFEDKEGGIWCALNNGISRIEWSLPLTYFGSGQGLNGSVKAIDFFQGRCFVATSAGLFYHSGNKNLPGTIPYFELLYNLSQQFWDIKAVRDGVFAASSNGLLFIDPLLNVTTLDKRSFLAIANHTDNDNMLVAGGDKFICIWIKDRGQWKLRQSYEGLSGLVRSIVIENDSTLWIATDQEGIDKLVINRNGQHTLQNYTQKQNIPTLNENLLFLWNSKLLVSTPIGLLAYRAKENKFDKKPEVQFKIENKVARVYDFKYDSLSKVYYVLVALESEERIYAYRYHNTTQRWEQVFCPLLRLGNFGANSLQFKKGALWICGTEGLARFDYSNKKSLIKLENHNFMSIINKMTSKKDSLLYANNPFSLKENEKKSMVIDYSLNELKFDFAAPYFTGNRNLEFQYYLKGFDEGWSDWTSDNSKSYTNLPEGDYTFSVRARNIFGNIGSIDSVSFQILPPWYRTIFAYFAYVILFFALLYLIIKSRLKRLEQEKRILEEKVRERTLEIARQNEEITAKAREIQNSYNRLHVLSAIGQELTAKLEIDSIFEALFRHIKQLMDADIFGVYTYTPEEEVLIFRVGTENNDSILPPYLFIREEEHLAIWCFKNRTPLLINNFAQEYNLFLVKRTGETDRYPASQLYFPLVKEDSILGVLTVQSDKPNAYQSYHLDTLKSMAAYTIIAFDNARAYHQIELQKKELETAYVSISEQNENLNKAYQQINYKNAEITDSILYARRIQESILPSIEEIKIALPFSFIYYKPRDIVSGDFYWFYAQNNKVVIAAADCTGHGIPGAFMSVMGSSLLNQIVIEQKIFMPEFILTELDERVRKNLHQDEEERGSLDGMDLALCSIDLATQTLYFSGANNPLYYISNNEFQQIPANKFAIGGKSYATKKFTKQQIEYHAGDSFYLFTDGYADQFGGPLNKKLLYKKFKEKLLEIHTLPPEEQCAYLDTFFQNWKGDNEQVDDVLIIGFRL